MIKLIQRSFLNTSYRGALQTDALDGIRGAAVLFVLFSHLANKNLTLLSIKFAGSGSGQIGVYLFFALSAFLLTTALLAKLDQGRLDRAAWVNYSSRRVTRIYPFYILALVFTVLATQMDWRVLSR